MDSLAKYLVNHLSCCLNCGSLWVADGGLCELCLKRLETYETMENFPIKPFTAKALYEWTPGQSDLLSRLVLSMKGPHRSLAWTFFAQKLAQREVGILEGQRVYVIPAPARREGCRDHAYLWAQALAKALGAEIWPGLRRVSDLHQRGGDRGQRALLEMEVLEKTTGLISTSQTPLLIFADDVLTTGATARAAYRALGSPPHFQVWVLAHRSLSCGASKDLL